MRTIEWPAPSGPIESVLVHQRRAVGVLEPVQASLGEVKASLNFPVGPVYGTRAVLFADLDWTANTIGTVADDPTPAFNGLYRKSGASGAGSWTRIGDLPNADLTDIYNTIERVELKYEFSDAITGGAPSAGVLKLNNASTALVTTIRVDYDDLSGASRQAAIEAWQRYTAGTVQGRLRFMQGPGRWAEYKLTEVVDSTGYLTLTVTHVASANTPFIDGFTIGASFRLSSDRDIGSDLAYTLNGGVIAKTTAQRLGTKIFADEYASGIDPSGATSLAHNAINAAILDGIARGKLDIMLPPTVAKIGGTIFIPYTGSKIRLIGTPQGTRIHKDGGTGVWLKIGDESVYDEGHRIEDVELLDLLFEASDPMTADVVVLARLAGDLKFRNVTWAGVRKALRLGGGTVDNDVVNVDMESCSLGGNGSGEAVIQLESGSALRIFGSGRHNGIATGSGYAARGVDQFIEQTNVSSNWDGLYVDNQFMEDWAKYVSVNGGHGIVNLTWRGKQVDGAVVGFDTSNQHSSGACTGWSIEGVQFLIGDSAVNFTPGAGAVRGLRLMTCDLQFMKKKSNIYGDGSLIMGNTLFNCGSEPTNLFAIGGANTRLIGNVSTRDGSLTAPVHAVEWVNGPLAGRGEDLNTWSDVSGSAVTGTV